GGFVSALGRCALACASGSIGSLAGASDSVGIGVAIEADDVAPGHADAEIDPAGVIGGDIALILSPILRVDMAVVRELARLRVEGYDAALRIGHRTDDAVVVFGHAHGHLWRGLAVEGEGPLRRVEFAEVAVEMGIVTVPAGEDGRIGAVAARRKGHREFFTLSGFGVDKQ